MSLPIQADAIRVALLQRYGGVWLDTDIIMINASFLSMFKGYELGMLGRAKTQTIGFIYASKNSGILKEWLKEIIERVTIYRELLRLKNKGASESVPNIS